jgi:archaellum biogenesis protein FlaJ (TadC family)
MLALKTWKFFQRGLLHFTIEDAYIFISAIVILTLIAWSPAYFFGWSVKIAFGITGLVLIILAISDFFRHIPRKEENKS